MVFNRSQSEYSVFYFERNPRLSRLEIKIPRITRKQERLCQMLALQGIHRRWLSSIFVLVTKSYSQASINAPGKTINRFPMKEAIWLRDTLPP
jgi:hypothetical protein